MKTEMTHRERILAAINHEPTDRVPMDYWGVGEIGAMLMKHFGVNDMLGLSKAMDLDLIMGVNAPLKPGRDDMWNVVSKIVPLPDGSGAYSEPVSFPIEKYETIDEIEANYSWPTTDMFDYSSIRSQCERYRSEGYAVQCGYIAVTYFYSVIRGIEQMMVDFAADEKLAQYILHRINEFASAHVRRMLEAADGLADITQVTDDFGSQQGLLMSEVMIEKYTGKYYESNVAMARSYGAKVFHHDDGAIMDLIPWLVGKGCQILNPIQWRLPGWDLSELKGRYGDKLCFHGGIDNQHVLPFGSPEDVRAEVRTCVDALYSDKTGYILAPCHNFQAITPLDNILTMYEYAKSYSAET
jgi:uroporphyrinogen decarboxylase